MAEVINGTQSKEHAHLMPVEVASMLGQLGSSTMCIIGLHEGQFAESVVRAHIKRLNLEIIRLREELEHDVMTGPDAPSPGRES